MAQSELFAGPSELPSGLVHQPELLSREEESRLLEGIRALELREAKYKEYTARRRGIPEDDLGYALVAEYRPGTQLGWHRDVPQFEAVVGVSLAGSATMRFRRFPPKPGARILTLELEPRSAHVLENEARWGWQHSIAPTPTLRYSITFRTRRKAP